MSLHRRSLERVSVFQIFDNNRALSENRESRGSVKSGTIKVSDIGCKRRLETGNFHEIPNRCLDLPTFRAKREFFLLL